MRMIPIYIFKVNATYLLLYIPTIQATNYQRSEKKIRYKIIILSLE